MINTKFRRPATRYRVVKTKSCTIPDQTLSLKTMVTKYVKGLPIAAPNLNGIYTEEVTANDFEKMDLADQEEAILRASEELSEVKGKIRQEEAEKRSKEAEKASQLQKRLDELEKSIKKD